MRASQLESTADTHTQFVPPLGKRVTESICTVFTVNATTAEYPQATRDKLSQLPGERLMQRPMRVANTVRIKVLNVLLIYIQALQITAHIPGQSYYHDGYHVVTRTLILFFQSCFITTLIIQFNKNIFYVHVTL